MKHHRLAGSLALLIALSVGAAAAVWARGQAGGQAPASPMSSRLGERIKALRHEAEALAGRERSLLVDLRRLEVERDLRQAEARQLDGEMAAVSRKMDDGAARIVGLEHEIAIARPALQRRLVDVYKLGRPGYARLLLSTSDIRDLGRTTRLVSALAKIDQQRVSAFTRTVSELTTEQAALGQEATRLDTLRASAKTAADLATKAAGQRADLVRQIDARRDLNAEMVGELEQAARELDRAMAASGGEAATAGLAARPIKAFRGTLAWPVPAGAPAGFGQRHVSGPYAAVARNGLEIAAAEGQPVRAVHEGRVVYADAFAGLGQLVIVDHGALAFSLYGYLGTLGVTRGMAVTTGQILGLSGRSPGGDPAVYFELRIDGHPVDPLQWLTAR